MLRYFGLAFALVCCFWFAGSEQTEAQNWQALPVVGAFPTPIPFPVSYPVTGAFPTPLAVQPVSGTFWQATQPVSGAFPTPIPFPASYPVTGTFWQATQPVSGAFFQTTQPVSGAFFQATQPVSGTFFQATQPVSGTVTANAGTGFPTPLANQPVSAASTTIGYAHQRFYPANTSGGGCNGVTGANITTGTQITHVSKAQAVTASLAQVIALSASTFVHICQVTLSGTISAAGAVSISTGTGTNCATTNTALATFIFAAAFATTSIGDGADELYESLTANEICVIGAGTGITMTIVWAQY